MAIYFDRTFNSGSLPTDYFNISGNHFVITAVASSGSNSSGVSGPGISNGSNVILTFDSPLSADTSYTLTILNTFAAGDGITLGNYTNREDFTFEFKTPDLNGLYTGKPRITFCPAFREEVAYEGDIIIIVDRPVAQSSISSVLSGLSSNFLKGNNQIIQDTVIDATSVKPTGLLPTMPEQPLFSFDSFQ